MLNTVTQGDCLELLPLIPDTSVDMILCDLPYGTCNNHRWDSPIPLDKLWAEYKRIIRPGRAIVLTARIPFSIVLGASNLPWLRYEWIWEKPNATGFLNANRAPLLNHENVLVFIAPKAKTRYNPQMGTGEPFVYTRGKFGDNYDCDHGAPAKQERHTTVNTGQRYPKTVLREHVYNPQMEEGEPYTCKIGFFSDNYTGHGGAPVKHARGDVHTTVNTGTRYPKTIQKFGRDKHKDKFHPTQKPVALFEYLLRTYTDPGEVVLDNCMGSGTTAIAALNAGRQFIGMESDAEYHRIAMERIANHKVPAPAVPAPAVLLFS